MRGFCQSREMPSTGSLRTFKTTASGPSSARICATASAAESAVKEWTCMHPRESVAHLPRGGQCGRELVANNRSLAGKQKCKITSVYSPSNALRLVDDTAAIRENYSGLTMVAAL